MNSLQRVIKYGAIAFGLFLSITIIMSIISGLLLVFGFVTGNNGTSSTTQKVNFTEVYSTDIASKITNIDIKTGISRLIIKEGNELKVEGKDTNESFKCEVINNTLTIKEEESNFKLWYTDNDINSEIIIYIPKTIKFESIKLKTGISHSEIDSLICKNAHLEFGIGNTVVRNIVADSANIETGVGKSLIENSTIETLKLTTGVGKSEFTGIILKSVDINCGIGKTDINLSGKEEDYTISTKSGIGAIEVNGQNMPDNSTIGNGTIRLNVEGGIGKVDIKIK